MSHPYNPAIDPRDREIDPLEINKQNLWASYTAYVIKEPIKMNFDLSSSLKAIDSTGVTTRGWYDLSGFRADADLFIWWTSDSAEKLQASYHMIRNCELGQFISPVWTAMATHRPSEFNKFHVPSCFGGVAPRKWCAFYPFVRSYEWYLLPAKERAEMLREHGMNGAEFPDAKASTLSAFALGDYEWILALETDTPTRLVDCMHGMRYVKARLHVREETPFYTGERVSPQEWLERQTG